MNINQQIIRAVESTIVQNIEGIVHLGPEAKEILAFIERFGGQEATALKSAVHELEDSDAPLVNRSAAKLQLKKFLGQLAGRIGDLSFNMLEKYLESRLGI